MGARASKPLPPPRAPAPPSSDETPSSSDLAGGDGRVAGAPAAAVSAPSLARMCAAVETLVAGLGEDVTREGLFDTPKVRERERRESCVCVRVGATIGGGSRWRERGTSAKRKAAAENFVSSVPSPSSLPSSLLPPQRVAKAWIDATTGLRQDVKT